MEVFFRWEKKRGDDMEDVLQQCLITGGYFGGFWDPMAGGKIGLMTLFSVFYGATEDN